MDTLPEYLKVGNFVRVAEWVGRIDDIATGEHIMILVSSPKQVYRHSSPEWLEWHVDAPELISPASRETWVDECSRYMTRTTQDYQKLFTMAEKPFEK